MSNIERPSLADAFKGGGVPDRSAGLSDLLAPPRPTVAVAIPVAQTAPTPTPTAPIADAPEPRRRTSPAPGKVSSLAETVDVGNVGVYIEPEVLEVLRRARRIGVAPGDAEKTYDELLVEALAKVSINDLRAHFTPNDPATTSLLPRRRRRLRGTAGIQVQLRLDPHQLAVIDSLKTQAGAPSRSAFVAASYRLSLLER